MTTEYNDGDNEWSVSSWMSVCHAHSIDLLGTFYSLRSKHIYQINEKVLILIYYCQQAQTQHTHKHFKTHKTALS